MTEPGKHDRHKARPGRAADSRDPTTEQALAAYRRSTATALESLFDRYAPYVRRLVGDRLPDADAEDVVQDVLLQALQSIGRFEYRGPGSFGAWLATMTRNRIIDGGRRARIRATVDVDALEPEHRDTPSRIAIGREWLAARRRLIANLPDRDRRLLELREASDHDFARIADRLGMPGADAARVAYNRIRRSLAERLRDVI